MPKAKHRFSIRKRISSFRFAYKGLTTLLREEHNSRIHLLATLIVVVTGLYLGISNYEWIAIVFAIGLVFVTEIINTSIENLSDSFASERSESIKKVKDLAAAAVLLSAIVALLVAALIFIPKF